MEFIQTKIGGLFRIVPKVFKDGRGTFLKTFNKSMFEQNGLSLEFKESYYSVSFASVIRGMHFQTPPHDHVKLVYVSCGSVTDVVLDIRKGSPSYGKYESFNLDSVRGEMLLIPKGCAHGFLSLSDNTVMTYNQTTEYSPEHDCGIRYDSLGFCWNVSEPQMSDRDKNFPSFSDFDSPFVY